MRSRFPILLTILLLLSACGKAPGPVPVKDPGIKITFPADGADILVAQDPSDQYFYWHWTPGYVTLWLAELLPSSDPDCPYAPMVFNLYDNGGTFRGEVITPLEKNCSKTAPAPEVSYSWDPDTLGLHTLSAELVFTLPDGTTKTFTSNSITVCVLNDPSRPVPSIPLGKVSAKCSPVVNPTPAAP